MRKICKILVVEDNDDVRQFLGEVLEHEGYHFVTAGDALGMRRILAKNPEIDVVILDVLLPGPENGLALAQEVADQGRGVILVTGDHQHVERLEASGHRYLLKPFRIDRLLHLVDSAL